MKGNSIMRSRRKFAVLAVTAAGMLILANTVRQWFNYYAPANTDNIIFADTYALSGAYDESLVIVANTVDGQQAGMIAGDAALVGREDVTFYGDTTGDLTVIGQDIHVASAVGGSTSVMGEDILLDGHYQGDVTVIGQTLTIGQAAAFGASVIACVDHLDYPDQRYVQHLRPCTDKAAALMTFAPFQVLRGEVDIQPTLSGGGLLFSLMTSLIFTGLAALAVTLFPSRFSRMQEAVLTIPRELTALGFMTVLLGIGITAGIGVLLAALPPLSILLIPLGLLVGLLLLTMIVTGWITLALLLGSYLVIGRTYAPAPPLVAVALGSFTLFALWHILALVPFGSIIALLMMAALGSLGLGGTLVTRLGARPLRRQYFVQG